PAQNGTIVLQQPLSEAISILTGPLERVGVVIHLDVTDAILFDQPFDHTVEITTYLGVAEIQQQTRVLDNAPAMPHEEPAVRLLRQRRLFPRHLRLEPKPRNHPLLTNPIQHKTNPARPARFRRLPRSHRG